MSPEGEPRIGKTVTLAKRGETIGQIRTDDRGRFAFEGLQGGSYELMAGDSFSHIRAWSEPAAPPSATRAALLIDGVTIRGQSSWEDLPGPGEPTLAAPSTNPSRMTSVLQPSPPGSDTTPVGVTNSPPDNVITHGEVYQGYSPTGVTRGGRRILGLRPWVWGVGIAIAAGIAIPLSLDNDDAS